MKKTLLRVENCTSHCPGYLPGMAFILAARGATALDVVFLSLLVYAGLHNSLLRQCWFQAAAAAIILTTFLVNLRHLLMSLPAPQAYILPCAGPDKHGNNG